MPLPVKTLVFRFRYSHFMRLLFGGVGFILYFCNNETDNRT